jgi:hypothetical protein
MGVLKIENSVQNCFTDKDVTVFSDLTSVVSEIIWKFTKKEKEIESFIGKMVDIMSYDWSLEKKLEGIVDLFQDISKAAGVSIWIVEEGRLKCKSVTGHYKEMKNKEYDLDFDQDSCGKVGLTAWIAKTGESLYLDSNEKIFKHPNHLGKFDDINYKKNSGKKVESFIGCPLRYGNETFGVIKADKNSDQDEKHFSYDDAELFCHLSFIVSILIKIDKKDSIYKKYLGNLETHEKSIFELFSIADECYGINDPDRILWNAAVGMTHKDGVAFNRCMIFDYKEEEGKIKLNGRAGLGPRNKKDGEKIRENFNRGERIPSIEDCKKDFKNAAEKYPLQNYLKGESIVLSGDPSSVG